MTTVDIRVNYILERNSCEWSVLWPAILDCSTAQVH